MIKYSCTTCKIDLDSSECPICGGRAESKSQLYWCSECNIPTYNKICPACGTKGQYISTDVRPVFPEERLLLEVLIGEPFKYINDSVWNGAGNRYIVNGEKLKIKPSDLMKNDSNKVIESLEKYKSENNYEAFNRYIEKFILANRDRYNFNVSEATNFIREQKISYGDDECFVSFSGGKDSTVVSSLVMRALGNTSIIHIFGDTTLEFPITEEYAKRFKESNKKTPFLSARNKEKNFYDMCETVGPPSRVMRWCCTTFKTGAITKKINTTFKNKNKVLTFYGIRRSESVSRSKYERVTESPKISKQQVVSPILDWFDFDIWLYVLTAKIDFNDAYRLGYSRVGCWCCPNNSAWSQYLAKVYMPKQSEEWRNQLIRFATKIGKPDPEVYIDEGGWKARQGGNGVEISDKIFVSFKPCANEPDSFNYDLKRPIDEELYELFKPFGWINHEMGNQRLGQVYVTDKVGNPIMRLQGKIGSRELKVTALKVPLGKAKSLRDVKQRIDCQLTKYQLCLGCLGCESACKHNAIIVRKPAHENEILLNKVNDTYRILDDKCVRCGDCIGHFDGGCYMRKVLITKKGGK